MSYEILIGDVFDKLKEISDNSIQSCITSPPYWGLRDYGHDNQIGLEATPQDYVKNMVNVFDEIWRVLKNDGTLWLNLGDSYLSHKDCKSVSQTLACGTKSEQAHIIPKGLSVSRNTKMLKNAGLKNKDLIGIPWRVAFALQEAGWYLRQDIIWAKPNPMPESVRDRCTKSHEYVFLLTKSAKYHFDNQAIKEPAVAGRKGGNKVPQKGTGVEGMGIRNGLFKAQQKIYEFRNKRDVWTIAAKPFKGAHFAVMPEALVEPCILAGSVENDLILDPFAGSGTVGLVALKNNRNFIGIELNPEYAQIAMDRINGAA